MKKILLFGLMSFLAFTATAQYTVSHWSAEIKGGIDYFRVEPGSSIGWTAPGLAVEYTVNPLVGFGGDLSYLNYDRKVAKGNTIDFSLFSSVNAANLLVPERKEFWSKVNVYTDLGVGFGLFHYNINARGVSNNRSINAFTCFAINGEYNLSDKVALCLGGQYRYYAREDMGGAATTSLSNDGLAGTVGLRFKLGATGTKHVRNLLPTQH